MSYRTRLRRDLLHWQELGLIDSSQRERIAAEIAQGPSYLHGALVLCAVIAASVALVAFVAANWSGMAPASRVAVLFLADAATVAAAYATARHAARAPGVAARASADGAATLSLAVAAATLALVAQTFHLPPDPNGFARTIALLGLATALVARSGGAALVAGAALVIGDTGLLDIVPARHDDAPILFWLVGTGLFLGGLSGWLPAKASIFLLLLILVANHFGAVKIADFGFAARPELILAIAVGALAVGNAVALLPGEGWAQRFREGGEALAHAAAGLCLLGFLSLSALLGWNDGRSGPPFHVPLLAIAVSGAVILFAAYRRGRHSLADLIVLGAAALSSGVMIMLGSRGSIHTGYDARHLPSWWMVWGAVVPSLALVVAGHVEERRALFGWALAATAGLMTWLLVDADNLVGVSLNLLGTAALIGLAIVLCRWADRRGAARAA